MAFRPMTKNSAILLHVGFGAEKKSKVTFASQLVNMNKVDTDICHSHKF